MSFFLKLFYYEKKTTTYILTKAIFSKKIITSVLKSNLNFWSSYFILVSESDV
jgi:hypothetical protein